MSEISSATGFREPQGVTESTKQALSTTLDRIARRMSLLMPGSLTGPRHHEVDDPEQPRVLEACHHAGTRRVEVDLLYHMALVYVQRINGRGVVQCPAARYRNRLIVTTPCRARRRANAATGTHTNGRKRGILLKRTPQYAKPWMFLADEIVDVRTNGTDTL
jgi:hypothetical protein